MSVKVVRAMGLDLSIEPNPLIPTLSPTGRGGPPSLRRVLRITLTVASLLVVSTLITVSWWIASLGPAPVGEGLDYSTLVVDRDGRLLRPYTTSEGRWRLPA